MRVRGAELAQNWKINHSMKKGKIRKDELENVIRIVKCLEQAKNSWLWYREIARRCRLNHKTVSRLISKYLRESVMEQEGVEPFVKIKMVKIKPGAVSYTHLTLPTTPYV